MKFSGVNLLDELSRDEFEQIRTMFHRRTYAKGAIICMPEQEEDKVFIISRGRVRIYLAYGDKEFTLGILGPGDLYSTHAGCFAAAFEDAELLLTDVRSVQRCMVEVPLFTRTMVRVLGHILKNSFSIIGGLVFQDIRNRLVDYLLRHAHDSGSPEGGGVVVSLDMTAEQLAQALGATRQTVSTLLNDLMRDGLLERRSRKDYFIPDLQALEAARIG